MEIIVILICMAVCLKIGWYARSQMQIDYRKRWKDTSKLLESMTHSGLGELEEGTDDIINGFKLVTYKRSGHYNARPETQVDFVGIKLVPVQKDKTREIKVNPETNSIGLDPADADFSKDMKAYRLKAQEAAKNL